jgi:hypothetical protein
MQVNIITMGVARGAGDQRYESPTRRYLFQVVAIISGSFWPRRSDIRKS